MTSPKYHQNLLYLPASLYKAKSFFQNGGFFSPRTNSNESSSLRTKTDQADINKVSNDFLHYLLSLITDRDLFLCVFWCFCDRSILPVLRRARGPGNSVARLYSVLQLKKRGMAGPHWSPSCAISPVSPM